MQSIASISVSALALLLVVCARDMAECRPSTVSSSVGLRIVNLHKNKDNFREHKCGVPKPQLHYIGEDAETKQYSGIRFYPPAVLVNRCSRTTGCCGNGGECTVNEEELAVFQVETVLDGVTSLLSIPISDHLSCKCIEKEFVDD